MLRPSTLLLGGLGLVGLYYVLHKPETPKTQYRGDDARVGDIVHVPVSSFPANTFTLIPPGVGLIAFQVLPPPPNTPPSVLNGLGVAWVVQEQPTMQQIVLPEGQRIGPILIDRTMVTRVLRPGQVVS